MTVRQTTRLLGELVSHQRFFQSEGLSVKVASWAIRNPKAAIAVMVGALLKLNEPLIILPAPEKKYRLEPWGPIQSGNMRPSQLKQSLGSRIKKDALSIFDHCHRDSKRDVCQLVILTVRQLHFCNERGALSHEFMSKQFCEQWSRKFLVDGQSIELCHHHDAAEFCIQYPNEKFDTPIHFVSEPIPIPEYNRNWIFNVEHLSSNDGNNLGVVEILPDELWHKTEFVFRLVEKP